MVPCYCSRFNHNLPHTFHVPKFGFCFCFTVFLLQCPNICIVVDIDSWILTQKYRGQLNVMAHAQKPDFVFRRNEWVHLNQRGRQFSRLLAAEVCASAVVMLDTPCTEVVWRVLATHSIRQFPLHFSSRVSPCAITFQLESTISQLWCMSCTANYQISAREWKIEWQLCPNSYQRAVRHCAVVCTIWQTRVEGWQQRCLNERCGSHFFVCRQ
jgi:hypothetical protein